MSTLVIGGTSGLGYEMVKRFAKQGEEVFYTGRKAQDKSFQQFKHMPIDAGTSEQRIGRLIMRLPEITTFVFASGYFLEGRISDVSVQEIRQMIEVGGVSLMVAMHKILKKQKQLDELITITSTSQYVPRKDESIYNFVKAGAAKFSDAMAEDGRVNKVLVVAPSGMKTKFWEGKNHPEWDDFLEPGDVADEIMNLRGQDYKYLEVKVLRNPIRVEEVARR